MSKLTTATKSSILTFGYGNRKDYDVFLDYIKKFNVTCVIDVRLSPRAWSRRWYGEAIENFCTSIGVQYIAKASLGNLSGSSHWVPPNKDEADQTLLEVTEMLKTHTILLICAELDFSRCHRVDIALELQALSGASVQHLV
jgi:uncharacterized protein (DUF488 family)